MQTASIFNGIYVV